LRSPLKRQELLGMGLDKSACINLSPRSQVSLGDNSQYGVTGADALIVG
jgi:hypothetical protein